MSNEQRNSQRPQASNRGLSVGWLAAMGSSVAAAFGVQSYKNRVRDFESGDIKKFVVSGLTLTSIILFGLIAMVQIILN